MNAVFETQRIPEGDKFIEVVTSTENKKMGPGNGAFQPIEGVEHQVDAQAFGNRTMVDEIDVSRIVAVRGVGSCDSEMFGVGNVQYDGNRLG